jgi:hypothetical protein
MINPARALLRGLLSSYQRPTCGTSSSQMLTAYLSMPVTFQLASQPRRRISLTLLACASKNLQQISVSLHALVQDSS